MKCNSVKAKSFFHKKKDRPNGIETVCKQCKSNSQKKYRDLNGVNKKDYERRHANWEHYQEKSRRGYLKANYGLTLEQYNEMLEAQGGGCKICGARENFIGDQKMLHVDHDHKTGKNRGILCGNCNQGIGRFKDSIENLTKAIAYLKQF
jgi:hypothetical protein